MRRGSLMLGVPAACALLLALPGCGGGGGGSAIEHPQSIYKGSALSPPIPAKNFTLRDQAGRPVGLAAQRGHYVIVTFLYTHCPDVCPVIAANLNLALRSAAARRAGLRVLAVSVDPARDTRAAVQRYVHDRSLLPTFHYLIGTRAELGRVWRAFGIARLAGPEGAVTHTAVEFLIDPRGRELLTYGADVKAAWVVHDLKTLQAAA